MPAYSLDDVRTAAQNDRIQFLSRLSAKDADNLSNVGVHVHECLCGLEESDFHKTISFNNSGVSGGLFDVYLLRWENAFGIVFPLYIKFKITTNDVGNIVLLASFHQERG